jgi:hypothetical protein
LAARASPRLQPRSKQQLVQLGPLLQRCLQQEVWHEAHEAPPTADALHVLLDQVSIQPALSSSLQVQQNSSRRPVGKGEAA